jgi:phage-related protein
MKTLPGSLLQESAKLQSPHVWVELLDFSLPYGRHWRIANNTESVTYGGQVYEASDFEPEVIALNKDAQMPVFSLKLSGLGGQLDQWLNRPGGLEDQSLTIVLVNTLDLTADYSDFTAVYLIRGHAESDDAVEFEIGGPNCYRYAFPFRRYMPTLCEVRFKGAHCGYGGAEHVCKYTLADCRRIGNATRFGGSPGARANTLRVVS